MKFYKTDKLSKFLFLGIANICLLLVSNIGHVHGETVTSDQSDEEYTYTYTPPQTPDSYSRVHALQEQAIQHRKLLLRQLNQAQWLIEHPEADEDVDKDMPEHDQLLRQLRTAEQQLSLAHGMMDNISGSTGLTDMLQQLLNLVRTKLADDEPVTLTEEEQQQYAELAQEKLDEAREKLKSSGAANSSELMKQLDAAQQRLDKAKDEIGIEAE